MNRYIDSGYKPEESLILRYYKSIYLNGLNADDIKPFSIKEGARIFRFINYKGVAVYIDDESTLMSGGTFKTLEACLTAALCRKKEYGKVVFSSGSNLGSALTIYGHKAGIETFFFYPRTVAWKIDKRLSGFPTARLISVDKPEKEVKKAALLFSELSGVKHIPEIEWRFLATGLRALFVFEFLLKEHIQFDWISQPVCAGYGPIGFYNMAQKMINENIITKENVPKFLGIQQEALSPMVKAWRRKHDKILFDDIITAPCELLVPSLYNTDPEVSYPMLYRQMLDYGGDLCSVNKEEYEKYLFLLVEGLAENNILLNRRYMNGKDEIVEKAGIIGLAGTLKAIDNGLIKKGEKVLSFFTGGAGNYSGVSAVPEYEIGRDDDLENAIKHYLKNINKKEFKY